jgi:hypothetical protein
VEEMEAGCGSATSIQRKEQTLKQFPCTVRRAGAWLPKRSEASGHKTLSPRCSTSAHISDTIDTKRRKGYGIQRCARSIRLRRIQDSGLASPAIRRSLRTYHFSCAGRTVCIISFAIVRKSTTTYGPVPKSTQNGLGSRGTSTPAQVHEPACIVPVNGQNSRFRYSQGEACCLGPCSSPRRAGHAANRSQ